MVRTLALAIEGAGYVVESCEDLGSAIEWLSGTSKVAAIVVDNNAAAGWVAAIAERARQGTPIVALLDPTESSTEAFESYPVVQKPFDTETLLAALEAAVTATGKKDGVGAWFKRLLKRDK